MSSVCNTVSFVYLGWEFATKGNTPFHYYPSYVLWFIIHHHDRCRFNKWKYKDSVLWSHYLPNLPSGVGQGVKRGDHAHQKELDSNLYTPLSLLLNCICQVVSQKCLTLSWLWVCDNWSSSWWSREYWLRKLHTTISKFDSFSEPPPSLMERCWLEVWQTEIVVSVSHSLWIQLWSEVLNHFRSWLLYEMHSDTDRILHMQSQTWLILYVTTCS